MSADKSFLTKKFGNVTADSMFTFEYGLKPISQLVLMADIDMTQITSFPFQTSISYTALDGSRCLRVITKMQSVSNEREELQKKADFELMSFNAIQRGAAVAKGGDVR